MNDIPEIASAPILPLSELSSPLADREHLSVILPKQGQGSLKALQANEMHSSMRELFDEGVFRRGLLNLYSCTTSFTQALNSSEAMKAIPYLNLLTAPTALSHALQKSWDRFKLMNQAITVGDTVEGLFRGGRAVEATAQTLSSLSKTTKGGLQLAQLAQKAFFAIIFATVLPIIMLVVGTIGGICQMVSLVRNVRALKDFNKAASAEDLQAIRATFQYLEGPTQRLRQEGHETDEVFQAHKELESKKFMESHCTNSVRYKAIQEAAQKLQIKIVNTMRPNFDNSSPIKIQLEEIFQKLANGEADAQTLESIFTIYGDFEKTEGISQDIRSMIAENKNEGRQIIALARSDIHRAVFYNALFLLLAFMVITDGVVGLALADQPLISHGLTIAICVLDLAYILFDKSVTPEQFLRLERLLKITPQAEPIPSE